MCEVRFSRRLVFNRDAESITYYYLFESNLTLPVAGAAKELWIERESLLVTLVLDEEK